MRDVRSVGNLLRRGVAMGLALAGLWLGTAAAENGLLTCVEAEDGQLLGGARVNGAVVTSLQKAGDGVQVTITVPEAGHYDVVVRQASVGGGKKVNPVEVNGQNVGDITSEGAQWSDGVVEYVWLEAGENAVAVKTSWGWINIDSIGVRASDPIPQDVYDVEPVLINPNATQEARQLMIFLCDNYGRNVISGQQCQAGAYGLDNQSIWRATGGTYPAVLGMDVGNYSPSRARAGDQPTVTESAIEYWEKHGGIITLSWHWYADERYGAAFYTDSTTFSLAKAMNGQDPAGYQMLLDGIDTIAVQLLRLQDAGVPVLWRPLHEASGGWFWWGASGPEPYLELYKLMYDRLTNHHGLNNLIWVWNGQDAAWYPGDEYVDIIGEDIYPGEKVYTSQAARFIRALSYTDARKLIALTENGCIPDTDLLIRDNVMWAWWCTWEGEFVLKSQGFNAYSDRYTEKTMVKKVYSHENVITRKNMPDLKTYPTGE
ncbi:MAG: beta-mannosidase [Clostridia bacterium]|nr:beta-mannosidase [Clostridia bacterium]